MATQEEIEKAAVDDFPILCETCLGDNPFVRMSKESHGRACKICDRPYSLYRWRPGKEARFNQTEICQMCAKLKNACQTCMLDLNFGMPTQIRDAVLDDDEVANVPTDEVNREYLFRQLERKVEMADTDASGMLALPYGKTSASGMVDKVSQQHKPYIKLQSICKPFLRGLCDRARRCPYRHEKPLTDKTGNDELTYRYQQRNSKASDGTRPVPPAPEDSGITTIFVGGIDDEISEEDLRVNFATFGSVASIRVIPQRSCGFVEMVERSGAEAAIKGLWCKLSVNDTRLNVNWARPRGSGSRFDDYVPTRAGVDGNGNVDAHKFLNVPPPPKKAATLPPPPGMGKKRKTVYPSQDPRKNAAQLRPN